MNHEKPRRPRSSGMTSMLRHHEYQSGQKVLLLLPSATAKLFAKWQGPYMIKKMGPVTYKVHHPDRGKESQIYHVNLLNEWQDRTPEGKKALVACNVVPDKENYEDEVDDEAVRCPQSTVSLEGKQREKLMNTFADYSELFRPEPGKTSVGAHY